MHTRRTLIGSLSVDNLRDALRAANVTLGPWTDSVWPTLAVAREERTLTLVVATNDELDLTGQHFAAAHMHVTRAQGGHMCPAEVGPQLALAVQRVLGHGEHLVLMEPLLGINNCPYAFLVSRGRLDVYHTAPRRMLEPGVKIVYAAEDVSALYPQPSPRASPLWIPGSQMNVV